MIIILDEPTDFGGYAPQNYGGNFAGQMLLCDALAQSQNVPAVKLLNQVGINVGYAYEMFTSQIGAGHGNHSLIVGYQMDLDFFKKGKNRHKSIRIL